MFSVTRHHCEVLHLDKSVIRLRISVRYCESRTAASEVSVLGIAATRFCLLQALHKGQIDPMNAKQA
jgi:hypothetical protein